ncbi:MAG TPA: uracil-DNA glycosylase [Methanomassiliicoccales archaeon]|nr:uracil-DNA glycosylase [Euryarchaeota archaeon]HOO03626.1 uracil-DNA glycosylase [Methanomassiliicoccales archaeon]HPD08614.1 uracil-DNA glycosylase [Methanomassiliicoccales archaeon]HQM66757.1 uracil-DNA glycosylase [Methanomassiliicoccales archaeon]
MPPDEGCRRCRLCEGRTTIVLPSGDRRSPVALVGEAPGEQEDLRGEPFVGRAGRTLDRLMAEAGLERGAVLITNTVKCRPPGNRRPKADEMAACRPFLLEELAGKTFVLALGLSAAEDLLGRRMVMKEVCNRPLQADLGQGTVTVMVTYHPSACVYRPFAKDALREALRTAASYL